MHGVREPDFIAAIPTTFDETVPICGEMGEYVAVARRKGSIWYVAAMNNWSLKAITIDLSKFLGSPMTMDSFADGINADRETTDYKHVVRKVTDIEVLTVSLAPGGGWAAYSDSLEQKLTLYVFGLVQCRLFSLSNMFEDCQSMCLS